MKKASIKRYIVVVGLVIIVFIIWNKKFYCLDYFRPLGISRHTSYEDVVKTKGTPLEVKEEDGLYYAVYDEFTFVTHDLNKRGFVRIDVMGEHIRFGWLRLGIGSSREDIEKAYRKVPLILDLDQNEFGIIDGASPFYRSNPWVVYAFDVNDKVEKIQIYFGP